MYNQITSKPQRLLTAIPWFFLQVKNRKAGPAEAIKECIHDNYKVSIKGLTFLTNMEYGLGRLALKQQMNMCKVCLFIMYRCTPQLGMLNQLTKSQLATNQFIMFVNDTKKIFLSGSVFAFMQNTISTSLTTAGSTTYSQLFNFVVRNSVV